MMEEIKEAAEEIQQEDVEEFGEESIRLMVKLDVWPFEEEYKEYEEEEPAPAKQAPSEEDRKEQIIERLDKTNKLKDLKQVIHNNSDLFPELLKKIANYKQPNVLKDEMYDILEGDEEEINEEADMEVDNTEPEAPKEEQEQKEQEKPEKAPAKEKAEKKAPEKKEAKKEKAPKETKITRGVAVVEAIRELCKKGATLADIMKRSDDIYVAAGGASNPNATNINNYIIFGLVSFGVLKRDGKKYVLK